MRFLLIHYIDESLLDWDENGDEVTDTEEWIRFDQELEAWDADMKSQGILVGGGALQSARKTMTLRVRSGELSDHPVDVILGYLPCRAAARGQEPPQRAAPVVIVTSLNPRATSEVSNACMHSSWNAAGSRTGPLVSAAAANPPRTTRSPFRPPVFLPLRNQGATLRPPALPSHQRRAETGP